MSNKLKVNKIYVITGFKHDKLKIHLDKLKRKLTVDLEVVFAKEWEKGNGASFFICSKSYQTKTILFVNGRPYFLTMNFIQLFLNRKLIISSVI